MSQKLIKFGKEQVPPKTALSGKSLGLHLSLKLLKISVSSLI